MQYWSMKSWWMLIIDVPLFWERAYHQDISCSTGISERLSHHTVYKYFFYNPQFCSALCCTHMAEKVRPRIARPIVVPRVGGDGILVRKTWRVQCWTEYKRTIVLGNTERASGTYRSEYEHCLPWWIAMIGHSLHCWYWSVAYTINEGEVRWTVMGGATPNMFLEMNCPLRSGMSPF